jgi:hypothetical protein
MIVEAQIPQFGRQHHARTFGRSRYIDGSRCLNDRARGLAGKALAGNRDNHYQQNPCDNTQGRIEPRQKIIQPKEPVRSHGQIVMRLIGPRNLECPNRGFGSN